jgi:UDP-glucose 4-epimerase
MSPYGVTKRAAELYLEYYRQVHNLRYVILRYANVYGPRQDPEGEAGVVAIFCGRILQEQRLIVYGDGEQTRDYVYVGDVARANILALRYLTEVLEPLDNVFNIGTGIETSVNALVASLLETANADCPVVHQPARPGEQARSVIDPSLAKRVLGWEPMLSLAEGLAQTLAWFRSEEAGRRQPAAGGKRARSGGTHDP